MRTGHVLILLGSMTAAGTGMACGTERWPVKVGDDPDAVRIDLRKAVPSDIAYLTAIPVPASRPDDARADAAERTVFVVEATLTAYRRETDGDYHLVLADAAGRTMIAEIPDPACVGMASPFRTAIEGARARFEATRRAGLRSHQTSMKVRVTGVGFFDFDHHQRGVAPNAIELHPVLDIRFEPSGPPVP